MCDVCPLGGVDGQEAVYCIGIEGGSGHANADFAAVADDANLVPMGRQNRSGIADIDVICEGKPFLKKDVGGALCVGMDLAQNGLNFWGHRMDVKWDLGQ